MFCEAKDNVRVRGSLPKEKDHCSFGGIPFLTRYDEIPKGSCLATYSKCEFDYAYWTQSLTTCDEVVAPIIHTCNLTGPTRTIE